MRDRWFLLGFQFHDDIRQTTEDVLTEFRRQRTDSFLKIT